VSQQEAESVKKKRPKPLPKSMMAAPPRAESAGAVAQNTPPEPPVRGPSVLTIALLALVIGWAYWPILAQMAGKWASDPQYSHSYLVPLFSLYLLWRGRSAAEPFLGRPSWAGLALLVLGLGLYLAGAYWYFDWFSAISLLPVLAGAALLIGGWPTLSRSALAIGFLIFMIPLPFRIETALSQPLQRVATIASTYVLQTFGLPALSEGNVIIINEARIGIVEACNGLGMMLLFVALATAVAIVVQRSWIEKVIIIASSIPIAVASNVLRITVTGLLSYLVSAEWADRFFHDFAGWFMMPAALGMLAIELWILSHMFVTVDERPSAIRFDRPDATTSPSRRSGSAATERPSANLGTSSMQAQAARYEKIPAQS
jgi:exosortase